MIVLTSRQARTELQEQLLSETEAQLELFDRVWSISPNEIQLSRLIDSGAFGEVLPFDKSDLLTRDRCGWVNTQTGRSPSRRCIDP